MYLCALAGDVRRGVLRWIDRLTIAVERASVTDPTFRLPYRLTVHDHVARALRFGELVVALARVPLAFVELPLLETARGQVLSEQHVEGGVDGFEGVIADENDGVEAFEDHADLRGRVPAVVAAGGEVRLVESVSTASAHGIEKRGTVLAVERVLWDVGVRQRRWGYVDIGGSDATVSMSLEV